VIHVARREALAEHLRAQGVQCALHYPVPLHLQECYRHLGWGAGSFLAAEASARELLSLPIYPGLGAEQQRYVVEVIAGFQG
jgi:dTDP-4-amino-4,6-dideoxygalactose transaminase